MKIGRICKTTEDEFENKEIKIPNKSRKSRNLKISCYNNILFIESNEQVNYSLEDIPFDTNPLISVKNKYKILDSIGRDNIISMEIIPPFGPFVEIFDSEKYELESIFEEQIYPIKSVEYKIDKNTAIFDFYNDNKVTYNVRFPIKENIKSVSSKID